jgi:Uma2 family endonuclease
MTKPRMPHQLIGLEIASDLLGPFGKGREGPGGWWIVTGPGIARPDNTLEISPDGGGWYRERMPKAPGKRAIRMVPDWVCEILSPTTRRHDLVDKMPYYAKIGVPHAWLVDPEARTVNVHRLEAGRWITLGYYSDETEADRSVRGRPAQRRPLVAACGLHRRRAVNNGWKRCLAHLRLVTCEIHGIVITETAASRSPKPRHRDHRNRGIMIGGPTNRTQS